MNSDEDAAMAIDNGQATASRLSSLAVEAPGPAPPSGSGVKAPRWRHHLCRDAVAPTMDVALILSSAPPSDAPTAPLNAQAAARARMLAMQAARRGLPAPPPPSGSTQLREGQLKAALWRCGDEAQQVWSVDLTISKIWQEGTKGEVRHDIPGMTWSPDGRRFAVLHRLSLVDAGNVTTAAGSTQHRRFVTVHRVSDGHREVLYELPATLSRGDRPSPGGCSWTSVTHKQRVPSVETPVLPKLVAPVDPALSSSSSAARLMPHQLAAANARAAANASGLASEQPIADIRGIGAALHRLPVVDLYERRHTMIRDPDEGPSASIYKAARERAVAQRRKRSDNYDVDVSLLVTWQGQRADFLFQGSAYLGGFELERPQEDIARAEHLASFLSATVTQDFERVHALVHHTDEQLSRAQVSSTVHPLPLQSPNGRSVSSNINALQSLQPARILASLSTDLHVLSTQVLAHLHFLRTTYTVLRTHSSAWQAHCRTVSEQFYSRPEAPTRAGLERDMLVLLSTGRVTDALDHLLAGNEGLTQGVLDKMKDDMLRAADRLAEGLGRDVTHAAERMLIVLKELKGCAAWRSHFATLSASPSNSAEIEAGTALLQMALRRSLQAQREAEREGLAWEEFLNWWNVERDRQDRLRRAEGGEAARPHHDALTVAELIRRGFVSPALDEALYGLPRPVQNQDISARREVTLDVAALVTASSPDSAVELLALLGTSAHPRDSEETSNVQAHLSKLRSRLETSDQHSTASSTIRQSSQLPQLFAGPSKQSSQWASPIQTSASLTTLFETVLKSSSNILGDALGRSITQVPSATDASIAATMHMGSGAVNSRDVFSTHESQADQSAAILVRENIAGNTLTADDNVRRTLLASTSEQVGVHGGSSMITVCALDESPGARKPALQASSKVVDADGRGAVVQDLGWYGGLLIALVSPNETTSLGRQLLIWRPRDFLRVSTVEPNALHELKPAASITLDGRDSRATQMSLNRLKSTAAIFSPPASNDVPGLSDADQQAHVSYWDLASLDSLDIDT